MTLKTAIIIVLMLAVLGTSWMAYDVGTAQYKKGKNDGYSEGYIDCMQKVWIPSEIPVKRKNIRLKEKK